MTDSKKFQSFDDSLPEQERGSYRMALVTLLERAAFEGDKRAIAYLNLARKVYEIAKLERERYVAKVKE